jgi:hypothetical protein
MAGTRCHSADSHNSGSSVKFTRPRGARLRDQRSDEAAIEDSIHAPVWGATVIAPNGRLGIRRFNSRAHVGRDMSIWKR